MKQENLIPNKKYNLQYSEQYCHSHGMRGYQEFEEGEYTFIGSITVEHNKGIKYRNIFIKNDSTYVMFACNKLDYIVEPKQQALLKFMSENKVNLNQLEELVKGVKAQYDELQ